MKTYDFIGIGIGPFNLSIAALAEGLDGFSSLFLERKPHFSWHPGMMVPDCHMQTSFLKDLVSAVEPTNRHSFLNYLVQRKKFYRFLTTEQRTVSREEFADYLCWAADNLTNLAFSQQVQQVSFDEQNGLFEVVTSGIASWRATSAWGLGSRSICQTASPRRTTPASMPAK